MPVAVVGLAFLLAAGDVAWREMPGADGEDPKNEGAIELRIAHYQLELGVRDALDALARDYSKLHPNVRIVQETIPDTFYGQWLTTQLIGGNPPDICQVDPLAPRTIGLSWTVWNTYLQRYFVLPTPYVNVPNPYNKGTELEDVPLRRTFRDGMRKAFSTHFFEYFAIPLSRFSSRVFYNKDLYQALTGHDEPPQYWHEFEEVCRIIQSKRDEAGRPYAPIANSRIHLPLWEAFADNLTHELVYVADFNRDGGIFHGIELWMAGRAGVFSFHHPAIRARMRILREISQFSQDGWTGLTRDEAIFAFVQQHAVFLFVQTQEAMSVAEMADGQFDVGVMSPPYPHPGDPEYGRFFAGLPMEEDMAAKPTGFLLSVTKRSEHSDVAIDFLLFLASQKGNEKLNNIIGWLPLVKGTTTNDLLEQFEPRTAGVAGIAGEPAYAVGAGTETLLKYDQLYKAYLVGQISLDDFLTEYEAFYQKKALADFAELIRNFGNTRDNTELLMAQMRSDAMGAPDPETAESYWSRYRQLMWQSQILTERVQAQVDRYVHEGPKEGAMGPYEMTAHAMDTVRNRIRREILAESEAAATAPLAGDAVRRTHAGEVPGR